MTQKALDEHDLKRFEGSAAIAVVGIGCLFPDAASLEQYWENIQRGHDAIGPIPLSHWRPEDYFDADPKKPDHTYAQSGGFIKPFAFDPLQFGLAPHALEATDSTQLLGMVAAHQALVDAGYGPDSSFDRDRVSCILGVTGTLELVIPLGARLGHPIWKKALDKAGVAPSVAAEVMADIARSYVPWQENSFPGLLGNVVAGRIANRLDLGGSNSVVDAACASSLAALHLAVMELTTGRSDMVITGGMDTFNDIFMYMCFSKTPALSPSGQARPFDAQGDGTILGEGLGAVVLKRLDAAVRDGDRVYAVIRGVGSSSDGKGQAIYAPSAKGQVKALERAYHIAGVTPRSIGLVEAHGTGTKVGDGVELDALNQVYRSAPAEEAWCTIGSVKSQIGHTKAAAGAAGLIKAVMALHHKVLPPTIKVRERHPLLDHSPFSLSEKARPWVALDQPRRAAVSAFGFGGSNYHCVVEEARAAKQHVSWDPDLHLGLFAAKDASDLLDVIRAAEAELAQGHDPRICARRWRANFAGDQLWRLGISARGPELLRQRLAAAREAIEAGQVPRTTGIFLERERAHGKLAFIFAGQGSQAIGMMSDLACRFPEFLDALQKSEKLLKLLEGASLQSIIYPAQAFSEAEAAAQAGRLTETRYAQLALAAVGLGTIRVLERFGVRPDLCAGHSFGELLALHASGVWQASELLHAAYDRGRLMNEHATPGGCLLAVLGSYEAAMEVIEAAALDIHPANYNAPEQIVFGGDKATLESAQKLLKTAGIGSRMLDVSAAFHTCWVSDAVGPFMRRLQDFAFQAPQKPVYSNRSAAPYGQEPASMREDLAQQIGHPLRFGEMLQAMQRDGASTFVEIGPSRKLQGIIKANVGGDVLSSEGDLQSLGHLLLQLSLRGIAVDWSAWDPGRIESQAKGARFHVMISGANYRSPQHEEPKRSAPAKSNPSSPVRVQRKEERPEESAERAARLSRVTEPRKEPSRISNREAAAAKAQPPPALGSSAFAAPRAAESPGVPAGTAPQSTRESFEPLRLERERTHLSSHSHEVSMSSTPPEHLQRMDRLLRDMQEMQRRTTDAHTLFLENQRQFQSMLRAVLLSDGEQESPRYDSAHRLQPLANERPRDEPRGSRAEAVKAGSGASPERAAASYERSLPKEPPEYAPIPQQDATSGATHDAGRPAQPVLTHSHGSAAAPSAGSRSAVAARILELIGQSTGYPAAMLEEQMDLEADLGIDSIKKVEIHSAVQQLFPHIPNDSTQMNAIRTIADLVSLAGISAAEAPPVERVGAWSAGEVALAHVAPGAHKSAEILRLIAEKTGFPASMLQRDLDLESDLGIDSIKKVEILSSLQELFPQLAALPHNLLQEARTIADLEALADTTARDEMPAPPLPELKESVLRQDELVYSLIAEKTGYPRDVITAEMDLEADLGIDSIKRVEILSALSDQIPSLQGASHDALSRARTIGDFLRASRSSGDEAVAAALLDPGLAQDLDLSGKKKEQGLERRLLIGDEQALRARDALSMEKLVARAFAPRGSVRSFAKHQEIWIADDGSNLARNMMLKLQERGVQARLVSVAMQERWNVPENLCGLILLAPLKFEHSPLRWLGQAFALLRRVGPQLLKNAAESLVITISRHGGKFGLDGLQSLAQSYAGGLAAFPKTVAREWPHVHARALDIGKDFADGFEAALRVLEASCLAGPVEIGVTRDRFYELALVRESIDSAAPQPCLETRDLVLVTGGARGVTAAALSSLAARYKPQLVIWGRSALAIDPRLEARLEGLSDPAALKQQLLAFDPSLRHPLDLERTYQSVLAARELRANIAHFEELGAAVSYHQVDVSKEAELQKAFGDLYAFWGVPQGIIHGAGILKDRLMLEQKDEEFAQVLDTKLRILPHLEDAARKGTRWITLFSSSTARVGRRGQVAYGLANEALNKSVALLESAGARALAMNWGPWDGGMVQEGLKKLFESEGVATIALDAGADLLLACLERPALGSGEWVVLAKSAAASDRPSAPSMASESWEVSLKSTPILFDHVLKHRAVTPAALLLEWMAARAIVQLPEGHLHAIENFRVWKGITLAGDEALRVRALVDDEDADEERMRIELRLLPEAREAFAYAGATCMLKKAPRMPQKASAAPAYPEHLMVGADALYADVLFHGEALQLIHRVGPSDAHGLWVEIALQGRPADWSLGGLGTSWQINAPLIDAMFQAAIVWSNAEHGMRCLPTRIGRLDLFGIIPDDAQLRLRLLTPDVQGARLTMDFEVWSGDDLLLARAEDVEAVMEASLKDSFSQNTMAGEGSAGPLSI